MSTQQMAIKEVCRKCGGTGIVLNPWVHNPWGFDGEQHKVGFICPFCKGEGYTMYTYEPFVQRKTAIGVEHIFSWPIDEFHTIDISARPAPHLSYSVSYEEWLAGKKPAEWIESFYCPFDIFQNEFLNEYFPHIYENPCSRCNKCRKNHIRRYMSDKATCWAEVHTRMKNGDTLPKRKKGK